MKLRFAVIGTGFWARYQIPAWMELEGVELTALYNRTVSKAEALASQYNIPRVYGSVEELLGKEELDFVDIITDVDTHRKFTAMAASKGVNVICQKPMAPDLSDAIEMVHVCKKANVSFFIHENWRWQSPIRKVKQIISDGTLGDVFKVRVTFCSGFPVFDNQPFLAELDEFILTDIGSHILDVCRFLCGEVDTLYCRTSRVNPRIKGEDVANVLMTMKNGITCYAEMSYASMPEHEIFPQTLIAVEGSRGSLCLMKDYEIRVTTKEGTTSTVAAPEMYPWLDPAYALVHSSIVDCNRDILQGLQKKKIAETNGSDNLETMRLVHAAYASARMNRSVKVHEFNGQT